LTEVTIGKRVTQEITVPTGAPCRVLHDDGREQVFEGVRLGHGSSWEPHKLRWFEITIYKHVNGRYIVHKVGRTVVYHRPTCATIDGRDDLQQVDEPADDREPCPKCNPDATNDPVLLERDKHYVLESDSVQGMIESLHHTDDRQIRRMAAAARAALRFARERDEAIMEVYANRSL
jgi:hypothetical protein